MSVGYIDEIVTRTGGLRHLRSPWTVGRLGPACSARGDYTAVAWDESDPRPLCRRCLADWRRFLVLQVEWATERLDGLEAEMRAREAAA